MTYDSAIVIYIQYVFRKYIPEFVFPVIAYIFTYNIWYLFLSHVDSFAKEYVRISCVIQQVDNPKIEMGVHLRKKNNRFKIIVFTII